MVVKVKESFEKTRQVKNNGKIKKMYITRRKENARYHERILSNKTKSYNINFISNST